MKCPNCEETLVMTERQGVEIDYCPKCRGVWLDKGELDKIIDKSTASYSKQELKQPQEKRKSQDDDNDNEDDGFFNKNRGSYNHANVNKRKGGFLENLFDF